MLRHRDKQEIDSMKTMIRSDTDPLRILIAEDEKNIRDLLLELLAKKDRQITVVHDGQDAVRKLNEKVYDLLITDLMMPEMDGIEVLHQARKLHPNILVIIITGYVSLETAIQAVRQGAYDYLRKPFRLEELKISVDNACERIHLIRENHLLLKHLKEVYSSQGEGKDISDIDSRTQAALTEIGYLGRDWLPPAFFSPGINSAETTLNELERLGNLLNQGLIDETEFQTLKKRLMVTVQ